MKCKAICTFLLFALYMCPLSKASLQLTDTYKLAISEAYAFNLVEAKAIIEKGKVEQPENNIYIYVENLIDCLELFNSENPELYISKYPSKKKRIGVLNKESSSNELKRYCMAQTYLYWAVLEVKFNNFVAGAADIKEAYYLLKENQNLFPRFKPTLSGLSIIHTAIGSAPTELQWVLNLIGISGSVNEGLSELSAFKKSINDEEYEFLSTEYYLIQTLYAINIIKSDENTEALIEALIERNDNRSKVNQTLLLCQALLHIQLSQTPQAINTLKKCHKYHLSYYLLGISYQNSLQLPSSKENFNKYLANKPLHLVKATHLRLAWSFILDKNISLYNAEIEKIKHSDQAFFEADKYANNQSRKKELPNAILLKARLLFDGGYYKDALLALKDFDTSAHRTSNDNIEYIYRLARIYHKLGEYEHALSYYSKTIELGEGINEYFAGNAALQTGVIYEAKQNYAEALLYYTLCLNMKANSSSVVYEAKANIARLKKRAAK